MADWKISGTYIEFCNCDPGCGCNFRGFPNSPEGNCEAFVGHRIEGGRYDSLELVGAEVAWALWWPGAVHEGGGRAHAYVDCSSDEQFEALSKVWRGEEGYSYFEIFNSTFGEPTAVDRAAIDMKVDGKKSRVAIEGVGEGVMTPLRNPVSGEENSVRIVTDGFIWKDGEIAQSERMKVDIPGINFDVSGRHAVFAPFEYANG